MALRAVIFGLEGILIKDRAGAPNTGLGSVRRDEIRAELREVFDFLRERGIRPIILSNRDWEVVSDGKRVGSVDEHLRQVYGPHKLYVAARTRGPYKPTQACITALLAKEHLSPLDVVVVGVSDMDFRTAVNSGLLFLNAVWDRAETDYGYVCRSPSELLRFLALFATKEHFWFYEIDDPIRYRSLGPYSTRYIESQEYSEAAEQGLKSKAPVRHFFLDTMVAALYFTGIMSSIDYIACIPGHSQGYGNAAMDDALTTLGGIFRKKYLRDLIVRRESVSSQRRERIAGRQPLASTQFNSLALTLPPLKTPEQRYKTFSLKGKTVLVCDDFTTQGITFEAVRYLIEGKGGSTVLVSCLKTINRGYRVYTVSPQSGGPAAITEAQLSYRELPYQQYIVDPEARTELATLYRRYREWPKKGRPRTPPGGVPST